MSMYISAIFKIVRQFFFLRNHGYHDRVVRRKYFVRETNRKKRLEFANNNINTPMEYWNGGNMYSEKLFKKNRL